MQPSGFGRRKATVVLGCLLLPFALLYWIVPWWSGSTLGNDYPLNSIHQQMELMLALQTGSFPLFVPTVYGGMTASALTLGELHHPIAHLAVRLPGYWQGRALDWNTVLRLVSLGVAHASLYAFLSRLGLGWRWSFGLGALTVYNLRMLDMFRYGASLESWAGYLMLCAALGVHAIEPTPARGPLTIIGATAWLVCSGHPQMAFYGLAGAGAAALLLPAFCATLLANRPFRPRAAFRFWLQAGACILAGIALSAAYLFPFVFEFLPETVTEGRYEWTDSYRDTLAGALNNFFQPLRADVHGAFGGSRLILVAALLPLVLVLGTRIPAVLWLAWAGGLVVFLHTLGGLTPLHGWMIQALPFTSTMRVPGRLGMLLPVLLLLILAWLVKQEPGERAGGRRRVAPRTLLAGVACVLIGVHFMLPEPRTWDLSDYSPLVFRHVPAWAGPVSTLLGLAALVALALHGMRRGGRLLEALVMLTAILETGVALRYGTWEEPRKPTPSLAKMIEEKRHDLGTLVFPGERLPTVVLAEHERRGARREPVLARVTDEYTVARDREEAYALVAGRPSSQPLVVEMDPAEARAAAESAVGQRASGAPAPAEGARVALDHAAFNRLVFDVWSARPGFFCLAYPYTGHWRAEVDGQPRPLYRANGAAHAVRVAAGHNTVEFRYVSRSAAWGMALSCLTGSGLAVFFGLRAPRRSLRMGALVVAVLIPAAGWAWRQSLYGGHGFGTVYTWSL